jgi:hypothetical protein
MSAHVLTPPAGFFAELSARQPQLAACGWAMLAVLLACLALMAFDPRSINGVPVWVKPAKFAASLMVWCWTLAWAWGVLAPAARAGGLAQLVIWATLVSGLFEVGWIAFRAALGQPSHFAQDAFGSVMFGVMGLAALVLVAMAALLGLMVLVAGDPAQPRPWRLAVGLGLLLAGVLGGFTGASIGGAGSPRIGGAPDDAGALAPFFWSRDGGDLRIAHFLGVHAMQALPLLALLGAGAGLVWAGAIGWAALTLGAWAAAKAGIALSP